MTYSQEEQNNYNKIDNNFISDTSSGTVANNSLSSGHNLEKVRDILFGKQIREHEQRFASLELLISQECTKLRDETKQRLDLLENYLKPEITSLNERLKNEKSE